VLAPGAWAEFKFDGYRVSAAADRDGVRLISRHARSLTAAFPEVAAAVAVLAGGRTLLLDGEVVAPGAGGAPDFEALQSRARTRASIPVQARVPVRFIVFDLLHIEGRDLTGAPLGERRRLLEQLLHAPPAALALSPTFVGAAPEQLLAIAAGHGLEGLVCKRAASLYQPGRRSRAWIKTVLAQSTEVTVIGCARGRARHPDGVGALLVAVLDQDGQLRYAGQVETGWTRDEHTELATALARLAIDRCPLPNTSPPAVAGARWALPELTGRVQFRHYTRAGLLRHPSWKGLLLR